MITRRPALGLVVPALVALLLPVAYFAVTGDWTHLATPVPGLVAVGAGVVGFGIGELVRSRGPHRNEE